MALGCEPRASGLAPLRHREWRIIWYISLAGNAGIWMQLVGAQWLMGSLSRHADDVAFLQTALGLPFFVLALPVGVLGDVWDRRRLLIIGELVMAAASALLGAVDLTGDATPADLLVLTFVLGAGQAIIAPVWLALQTSLVPPGEIAHAAALDGVGVACARALGPAIGGAMIAIAGPWADFLCGTMIGLTSAITLIRWKPRTSAPVSPERFGVALRRGLTYVAHAAKLRSLLIRLALFSTLAGALWALLPNIARHRLGLGATGYGLLFGSVGLGGAVAVTLLARLQRRFSGHAVTRGAMLAFASATLLLAATPRLAIVVITLLGAGGAWVTVVALLDTAAQSAVDEGMRARGLAAYEAAFQGGMALSGLIWGAVAAADGSGLALALVSAGLVITATIASQ